MNTENGSTSPAGGPAELDLVAIVTGVLVHPHDVVGAAVEILTSAAATAGAVAGGLILRRLGQDRLQLLAHFEDIEQRWPDVATLFRVAGFTGVQAVPLHWAGDVIGALNMFYGAGRPPAGQSLQVFADLATLAIVHCGPVSATAVLTATRRALDERTVIEQAKGVLAVAHRLDLGAAYQLLLETARERGELLSSTATAIVQEAGHPV